MTYQESDHDSAQAAGGDLDFPAALGWRRMAELDEESREAWELRDGTVLLLDPTGRSDSRVCPPRHESAAPALF
jgi:hypothetical protein